MLNLEQFISKYVTERDSSLFAKDIQNNSEALTKAICGKTMLVIGGAGSIGSSYIKACLQFKPKALVVVDVNENGLAELTRDLRSTKGMYVPDDYVPYPINYAQPVFEKMFRARGGFDHDLHNGLKSMFLIVHQSENSYSIDLHDLHISPGSPVLPSGSGHEP